jgi:undecaprenyl-diphosphatase
VVGETALALLPVNLAVESLKWVVWRTRPDGDTHRRNSSFPSSHAANAFTVAAVVGRRWRRVAVPIWLGACLVGYSRMLLDRHWATDILGALLLALAGAWLAGIARDAWRRRRAKAASI